MSNEAASTIERRFHNRYHAKTIVRIRADRGKQKVCKVADLSAHGVALRTDGFGLNKNQIVELTFIITLGTVVKLHRRKGRVCHVTKGVTGFSMMRYEDKIE